MGLKVFHFATGVVKSVQSIRRVTRETIVNVITDFLATINKALAAFGSLFASSCFPPFHQKKERIGETPNWLSLPDDMTCKILGYIDQYTILEHVQLTCKSWYHICKDPAMWKTVDFGIMKTASKLHIEWHVHHSRLKAVSRGARHVNAITVEWCPYLSHFLEISHRTNSSLIKRLTLYECYIDEDDMDKLFARFPSLEVFEATFIFMKASVISALGRNCPLLHTFRFYPFCSLFGSDVASLISENLPGLRHINICCVHISNEGLEALLNSCKHLESLDLRSCNGADLKNGYSLLKRLQQIKHLRLPHERMAVKEAYFSKLVTDPKYLSNDELHTCPI